MSDLLQIGASALLSYQGALATTAHNIANVNTTGYTRQRVQFDARTGDPLGRGVQLTTVNRVADAFVTERLRGDASALGREEILAALSGRVDQMLSDPSSGLSSALASFLSAVDSVAAAPADTAARAALMGAATTLAGRFQGLDQSLDQLQQEVSSRLQQTVSDINGLTQSIASFNQRIAQAQAAGGGVPPNDLIDQREQLLGELSSKIGISTLAQTDGTISVFTGAGQALVLGVGSTPLSTAPAAGDTGGTLEIYYGTGAGAQRITSQISGGEIGGLLDSRREVLDPTAGRLGRIAVALSEQFNTLHSQGVDLTGALGGDFFSGVTPEVIANGNNAGTATAAVNYADVGQLTGDDYSLRYDGAAWHLSSRVSGAEVALGGSGTLASPYTGAGLSLVLGGVPAAGDSFVIRPTSIAAGQIEVAITDPARFAAAAPLRSTAAISNTGSGVAAAPQIVDINDPGLSTAVTIDFLTASTYSINGAGSFAYTSGTPISLNGWSLSLSGTPATGDQFRVLPTGPNSGDNVNARALAGLRVAGVLDGGTASLSQANISLVGQTGTMAQQAQLRQQAQQSLQQFDMATRDSVSGVNLDEEAADMVRFQKSYQAAAQIIATANTIFDSLLSALRR
jgi:flagellar hook-associated protein 1 FlgK